MHRNNPPKYRCIYKNNAWTTEAGEKSQKALVADKKTGCNAASALANHKDHMGCVKMYPAEEFCLQAACTQAIILQTLAPRDKINLRGVNQIELKTCCEIAPRNGQAANKT